MLDTKFATLITSFDSEDQIVVLLIAVNFAVLCVFAGVTIYQAIAVRQLPNIHLVGTRRPPLLALERGCRFHLFLSHTWSSGQDQVAIIKRQLLLLLPGIRVFLVRQRRP